MSARCEVAGAFGSSASVQREIDEMEYRAAAAEAKEIAEADARRAAFLAAPDASTFAWALDWARGIDDTEITQFVIDHAKGGDARAQDFLRRAANTYAEFGEGIEP